MIAPIAQGMHHQTEQQTAYARITRADGIDDIHCA
jgi:hypothetical protein